MPEIRITVSDRDWDVLLWGLTDPHQWAVDAVAGKVNQLRKRRNTEWIPKLRGEGTDIPADDTTLDTTITTHTDYEDRATREAPPPAEEEPQ